MLDLAEAEALLETGANGAFQILCRGVTHAPRATGTGEWDDGAVRHLLADAIFVILRDASPADAFDRLGGFLDPALHVDWFSTTRGALVLKLLVCQVGRDMSTWLSLKQRVLSSRGVTIDPRFLAAVETLASSESPLAAHAAAVRVELEPPG